jgi:hypothetical protein
MKPNQSKIVSASDDEIRRLLDRYQCPIPFHEVRTRVLGNIASPRLSVSPLEVVKGLWGGKLPQFDDLDAANELLGALIMGMWNRLSRHQERNAPFRLLRFVVPESQDGLRQLALIRRQELDGFIEGLFGKAKEINLPERAHNGLGVLSKSRSFLEGIRVLAVGNAKAGTPSEIADTLRHVRELTKISEHEIHAVVLSCKRARGRSINQEPGKKEKLNWG